MGSTPWKSLYTMLETSPSTCPPRTKESQATDTLMYMYTSGTTGLPKAVLWSGLKNIIGTLGWSDMFGCTGEDVLYTALPLYHGNGMVFANNNFFNGGTTVIKKKFSSSQFMRDCCLYNVTVINYIGEICRYLLKTPPTVFDTLNTIRIAGGNGMKASIWKEFQTRFGIDNIVELYAATEGTTVMYPNSVGRVGAVGYRPLWLPNNDLKLLRMNIENGEILRGEDGLAVEAGVGELGQLVGILTNQIKFEGYTNESETKKKIGHDILIKGDSAYLTGDTMVRDEEGFYYFQDRIGDTFRWKGENVSTNEVEGLISKVTGQTDVCVYGVQIPSTDGRAGMTCIVDPEHKISIDALSESLSQVLPRYAWPQFVRVVCKHLDVTGTYKFQKNKLREEGYNPSLCGADDELYYFDHRKKHYLKLDDDVYNDIMKETIAF